MIAASSIGVFCRVPGLYFDYLEVRKTNEQRAIYQDNTLKLNRVSRTLRLFHVIFQTVRVVSGTMFALIATWFVVEKQIWVAFAVDRIHRGDY